jgi:hypothetical protein
MSSPAIYSLEHGNPIHAFNINRILRLDNFRVFLLKIAEKPVRQAILISLFLCKLPLLSAS